jgi:hypothetical protein
MAATSVYATAHLLRAGQEFEPGDLLSPHYAEAELDWLIAHGQASPERPAGTKAAYCAVEDLRYHAGGGLAGHRFERGDRIDEVIPAAVVREIVARGDATYTVPEA